MMGFTVMQCRPNKTIIMGFTVLQSNAWPNKTIIMGFTVLQSNAGLIRRL